ncbi:MAG: dihydroorotase [Cyanobacteria bacterium]|nr:dihydroorotase [Cyanobacteriota bacterium]MDW8200074.1 dihydroorotase [Cyanobacteriota bacterium SKYGB_h_bin112]
MTSILLQRARVLDPMTQMDQVIDVLITDGTIAALAPVIADMPADTNVCDCQGLVLAPGLVDCYSHSGEPGYESRETLASLKRAAMAGGFTRIALLPDTQPTIDQPALVAQIQQQWLQIPPAPPDHVPWSTTLAQNPRLFLWGALTVNAAGQQMAELGELAKSGVIGFADGAAIANLGLVQRLLEYAQPWGKPIALYACDHALARNGVLREGLDAIQLGLPIVPVAAESAALAALLEVVASVNIPVHIMRVSTARSVDLIATAKARGLPITASTTWMHLLLNTKAAWGYDPNLRLEPPLGTPEDQTALVKAVQTGVIDAIAIDHTPYTYEEKTVAFAEAPPGAIGLELALPLLWQAFVVPNRWTALELWQALSTRPAICLGQTPATIAPGHPAEAILFDPQQSWQVTATTLQSLARNTPWYGQTMTGRVVIP